MEERPLREEGVYAGRVLDYTVAGNRNTVNPQVVLILDIFGRYSSSLDAPEQFTPFPAFRRRVYMTVTVDHPDEEGNLVRGTALRVLGDLQYLGFPGQSLAQLKADQFEFDRLKVSMWELRNEFYGGRWTERWSVVRPLDRSDPGRLEAFLELHRLFEQGTSPARAPVRGRKRKEPEGALNGAAAE